MNNQMMLGSYSHVPLGHGGGSGLAEGASGMDAAAEMVGTIRCAGCGGAAGDYLGPPDLSNACSWCGGRLPLCDHCARAVSFSAIGESGGGGGGGGDGVSVDEMIAAEAVCCCACARLVCSGPECSTRCSNMSCETVFCSSCRLSLSECSGCLMPHCRPTGDPGTDCLLPCQGHPECREAVCRLCESGRCGCEVCGARVCDYCRKECGVCRTVSCPECLGFMRVQNFCEGCNADRCLLCVMRSRPCDMCGHPVSADRVREHMASTAGFIEKWSKFCLGRNSRRREESVAAVAGASAGPSEVHHPPRSIALRAEVAHRWMSVAAGRGASAGGSCAAVAAFAGDGAGVGGEGIGAAGAAGVASGASGIGAGSAVLAVGVGATAAGATAASATAAASGVVAGAADVGPAAAGMGAAAAAAATGCGTAGSGPAAAAGADMARTNTWTPVPHAPEALQTKPPPAAIPQPTEPAAAGVAGSALSSRRALKENVPAGSAGHGEGVRGAAVGESADKSSLLGASVLSMLEQARKVQGGGQGLRRLPVEHVQEVVAMWEEEEEKGWGLAGGRRSKLRSVTSVETVQALFSGWVESDVVDLYHGGSEDVRQTLKQCREAMEQVVANEHAASAAGTWTMYTSPDHDNRPYWHNAQKNETTWENPFEQQQRPQEVQQAQAQPRGAAAAAVGGAGGGAESSPSASTTVPQLAMDVDSMAASWEAGEFNHDQFTSWVGRVLRVRSEIRTRHEEGKSGGGLAKFSAPVQDSPRGAANDVRGPLAAWPGSSVATREAVQVPHAAAAAAAAAVGEDRRQKAGPAAASAGAASAAGAAAGAAACVARAAAPSSDIPRATTGREQQVPLPAAVETKKASAVETAGLKMAGQETAAAAAVAKKPAAAKAAEQPLPQQQLLKRGASAGKKEAAAAAAGAVGVGTLEAQMADLRAAEERKQAAKAKKAARRAEEVAEREDRETQEAVARKQAAARRREATAAAAARSKAEAAARETARIAEAKAATEARVMAAVAAQAKAEKEAKEVAKKTAKENDDLQQANRAKRQERAKAVADAMAANEARAVEKAQWEEREAAAAAAAAVAGPAMRGGGVGGGGALLADMSLEIRLKKAIDNGNALAVQSIYDEADQTPGASMKKIKKKCQRYLNKKAGEDQKLQQASQPALVRGAGAGAVAAQAAAAQRPTQHDMFCPNNIAPQLIGKQGQTITKLMKESRAKIVVKPYPDRIGNDVVITGTPNAVKTAKRLVEEFYRSKGCQPTALPPPSCAVAARKAEGARARPAQPVTGGPGGGGGGGAAPVVVEDGAWGGELRQLLRVAGCEHHLERFREDQLDGEVLLMMDRRDFERMGVTEGEQIRILNALKGSGGGGVDDSDEDSDGLDPDHPDTCKICLDALVDILFLPCAHQCTCSRCGSAFQGKPCILCRRVVDKVQRVIKLRG